MHVSLVSDLWTRSKQTGVGVYMQRVLQYVPAASPDTAFTAFGFQDAKSPPVPPGGNLRYAQVPGDTKLSYLRWLARGAGKDLARLDPSVSIAHALHPLPASTKAPWICTVHDISPVLFPKHYPTRHALRFRLSMRVIAKRGAHVLAISQTTADDVRRVYDLPESRVTVIPYGIDATKVTVDDAAKAALTARYRLPPRFALFVGVLNRQKNLVALVHAFAKVAPQVPDAHLVLVGPDGLGVDEVRAAIAAERLDDRVHLPGYAPHDDVLQLMAMSDVFAFPSLYEGFGLPPVEAMVQGTPVVACSGGSVGEVVGDAALVSDPADVDALAANLLSALTEPDVRANLIARGLARSATFKWELMAQRTIALYEQLAG